MFPHQESRWRWDGGHHFDAHHHDLRVRVKGDEACKQLASKLMRNGIQIGRRELSTVGRPFFEFHIHTTTRAQYAKAYRVVDSTNDAELLT